MFVACFVLSGTPAQEREYLFAKVLSALCHIPGRKAKFSYRFSGALVCRQAFCTLIGLRPDNARVRQMETKVRRDVRVLVPLPRGKRDDTRGNDCKSYLRTYVLLNSDKSPVDLIAYVDLKSVDDLYDKYKMYGTPDPVAPS